MLSAACPLQEFVQRCVVSEARSAFYLYTTPPRQQLKDLEATLYRAQLVPAANVHVHVQEDKSGWLGLHPSACVHACFVWAALCGCVP